MRIRGISGTASSVLFWLSYGPCAFVLDIERLAMNRTFFFCLFLIGFVADGVADGPADNKPENVRPIPPVGIEIPETTKKELLTACAMIRQSFATLLDKQRAEANKKNPQATARLAEIESLAAEVLVFPRAIELSIEFRQFYKPNEFPIAKRLLQEAERRLAVVRDGGSWFEVVGLGDGARQQLIVGGFKSKIDGSYQPYSVVVPAGFLKHDVRPRRLDLWFHGRGERMSEANFLQKQMTQAGQYTPSDTFVLHPYGRYSNAFKFAGEIDVLESLQYVRSRLPVDKNKIAVRGFSMGGAGCWQMAVHYADRFFAANPGAGFSETPEFLDVFQGEDARQNDPAFQRTLWQLYDCPPWAINLSQCPTVVYSGEVDRQKQAADVMEKALEKVGIDMLHVIGPDTAHKIHADSKVIIEAHMNRLAASADASVPKRIQFATMTLRYHKLNWVDVQGLQKHWKPASVDAQVQGNRIVVNTSNVSALDLVFQSGQWPGASNGAVKVEIDGTVINGPMVKSDRSWRISLLRDSGGWTNRVAPEGLRKRPGLQGPIDDALMDSFIFVLPTFQSPDAKVQQWIETESQHAMLHWRKHFRGDVRKVTEDQLTDQLIENNNLIVFGDPRAGGLVERLTAKLPIGWNDSKIKIGDHSVDAEGRVGILVYPNPMNPDRYVVLNSGFTFREYDYLNNARQTPKLPDWALVDVREGATTRLPGKVEAAGFFDEQWQP